MAATIGVFFKHDFIGKKSQAKPYTARAHSRYVQRQSATQHVHVHLLPENYNARQRWFFDHENRLRANGRVIDKFIISVPRDVSEIHAISTLKAYGERIGQGVCPFMFTLQGFDTDNHHAHFIFIDRSVEDGKRVYGTTERNSTQGLKLEWQDVANDMFAELGYDVRVKVKDWAQEQANDNERTEDLEPPAEVVTVPEPELAEEDAQVGADDMAEAVITTNDFDTYEGTLGGYHVRKLYEVQIELNHLHDMRIRVAEAEARYASAQKAREAADLAAGTYKAESLPIFQEAEQAEGRLQEYTNAKGKLRGLGFKVFGYEFKTEGRKQAESARSRADIARYKAHDAVKTQQGYDYNAAIAATAEREAERAALLARNKLIDAIGNDEAIDAAEKIFENTTKHHLDSITKGDVTVEALIVAMWEGEITIEEVRTYLTVSGQEQLLSMLEEGRDKDRGEELEL